MNTLGLWCAALGAYDLLQAKQIEVAKMSGCKSLVSGGRVSARGHCAYLRRHPTAKPLFLVMEVDLD